jgi:predicted ATP-binding protein involved in virulence
MYIKKLTLKNIRSIEHFEMSFPDGEAAGWHVIIGDNGAGKSSVVKAASIALIGPNEIGPVLFSSSKLLRIGTEEGSVTLDNIQPLPSTKHKEISNKENLFTTKVRFDQDSQMPSFQLAQGNKKLDKASELTSFSVGFGPFRRFQGSSTLEQKGHNFPKFWAHRTLFSESYALGDALDWLNELDATRLRLKEKNIQPDDTNAIGLFENTKQFINESGLLPHGSQFDQLDVDGRLLFKDGNGNSISALELSDGYRSMLSLLFTIIQEAVNQTRQAVFGKDEHGNLRIIASGIVLIDEVDAHLHPSWQTRIGHWFTKYLPNVQFIVTTHSPLICRACDRGSIWKLSAPGSKEPHRQIMGIEKDRLVYGNILDAYGTDVFGETTGIGQNAAEMRNRLGELYEKSMMGLITDKEDKEFQHLRGVLPTFSPQKNQPKLT